MTLKPTLETMNLSIHCQRWLEGLFTFRFWKINVISYSQEIKSGFNLFTVEQKHPVKNPKYFNSDLSKVKDSKAATEGQVPHRQ